MKKVFLFGVLLALLILAAAGCGSTAATETVTVKQTDTVVQTVTAAKAPVSTDPAVPLAKYVGTGDMTTVKFPLNSGMVRFVYNYKGEGNFSIFLKDSQGKDVSGIANTIGDADSTKVVNIREDGDYMLDVQAEGSWAVAAYSQ
jgi:hypothetical protein